MYITAQTLAGNIIPVWSFVMEYQNGYYIPGQSAQERRCQETPLSPLLGKQQLLPWNMPPLNPKLLGFRVEYSTLHSWQPTFCLSLTCLLTDFCPPASTPFHHFTDWFWLVFVFFPRFFFRRRFFANPEGSGHETKRRKQRNNKTTKQQNKQLLPTAHCPQPTTTAAPESETHTGNNCENTGRPPNEALRALAVSPYYYYFWPRALLANEGVAVATWRGGGVERRRVWKGRFVDSCGRAGHSEAYWNALQRSTVDETFEPTSKIVLKIM